MSDEVKITPVLDEPDLRLWEHRGQSDRLVVSFSGIGPDPADLPEYEFASTATGGGKDWVLYVADPTRSWLNAPGLIERIAERVESLAAAMGAKQICTLGHSMGGYSACVLSGFTRVDVAVALSPQSSVHPDVAGDDPRWMNYREKIAEHRLRGVPEHLSDETEVFAFFGAHRREAPQRDRFPVGPRVHRFVMPRTHHNTAQRLKRAGVLNAVVQAAFDKRIFRVRRLLQRTLDAGETGVRNANGQKTAPAGNGARTEDAK